MTVNIPAATRRSRWLLDWSASSCLAAADQSLNASTGQVATLTRAGAKTAVDQNGVVRTVPSGLPAFQWSLDPVSGLMVPGVLLEGARTNVVLWNRDLTNAAWTKTNVTTAKTITGADGIANTATSLTATAGNATALQAITLASSARYQSAYVKRITGSGVINMTTDNGATWTAIAVTSAWTRVTIPTQTLANPTVGFQIVTSGNAIAVDYVQNEDGATLTSPIATTTVAVARALDLLSLAIGITPRALTVYCKLIDAGYAASANATAWVIGNAAGGNPYLVEQTGLGFYHDGVGQGISSLALVNARDALLESLTTVDGNADITISRSTNGGAATSGSTGVTATLFPAAWSAATLSLGGGTAWVSGNVLMLAFRIAAGVQTLATMRQG